LSPFCNTLLVSEICSTLVALSTEHFYTCDPKSVVSHYAGRFKTRGRRACLLFHHLSACAARRAGAVEEAGLCPPPPSEVLPPNCGAHGPLPSAGQSAGMPLLPPRHGLPPDLKRCDAAGVRRQLLQTLLLWLKLHLVVGRPKLQQLGGGGCRMTTAVLTSFFGRRISDECRLRHDRLFVPRRVAQGALGLIDVFGQSGDLSPFPILSASGTTPAISLMI